MTQQLIRDDEHIVELNACHRASWTSTLPVAMRRYLNTVRLLYHNFGALDVTDSEQNVEKCN